MTFTPVTDSIYLFSVISAGTAC